MYISFCYENEYKLSLHTAYYKIHNEASLQCTKLIILYGSAVDLYCYLLSWHVSHTWNTAIFFVSQSAGEKYAFLYDKAVSSL